MDFCRRSRKWLTIRKIGYALWICLMTAKHRASLPLPSGTVTFLFTDIEGSTRLWETDHDAMRKALARHDDILRKCIAALRSQRVNTHWSPRSIGHKVMLTKSPSNSLYPVV